ncbi:MAG: hypothetical protein KGP01_00835 [Actinomycetales bacterium]|nr:hypothetical protein [Actinomycetales bacterium]
MLIDCGECAAPKSACADCVVTAILGPQDPLELQPAEVAALQTLATAGLVRPLRLLPVAAAAVAQERGAAAS